MSQNQNLQDYLNKNFPEKEENQQQNTSNFYPQTQSFLPQNYEFENSNQNLTNQNLYNQNINNPNLSNPNLYNQNVYNQNVYNQNLYNQNINNPNINNPFQNQQSQSLMQKINSTASNVLDFFKSKTENISIPKNPLIKVDYSQNLLPLNQNGFEGELSREKVKIYYMRGKDPTHSSIIEEVKLSEGGALAFQPKGFFDQDEIDYYHLNEV